MTTLPPGLRRLCLVVDVEGYSRHPPGVQIDIQRRMLITIRRTCADAQVNLRRAGQQDRGDGQLIVLDPSIDEASVLPGLVNGLTENLYDANRVPGPGGPLRLRVALSQGVVHIAAAGFAGDAVISACRLLDSEVLHRALRDHPGSDLALVITDDLFASVAAGAYPDLPPDGFRQVTVAVLEKQFRASGWILVPGRPPHAAGRRSRFGDPLPADAGFGLMIKMGGAAAAGAAGAAGVEHLLNWGPGDHHPGHQPAQAGHPHGLSHEHGGHHQPFAHEPGSREPGSRESEGAGDGSGDGHGDGSAYYGYGEGSGYGYADGSGYWYGDGSGYGSDGSADGGHPGS